MKSYIEKTLDIIIEEKSNGNTMVGTSSNYLKIIIPSDTYKKGTLTRVRIAGVDNNKLIGINNRNLDNFSVNISSTLELTTILPESITTVSESGIKNREDIKLLHQAGVDAILVGEYLMRANDMPATLEKLKKWCRYAD